jgi:hypothetical protein
VVPTGPTSGVRVSEGIAVTTTKVAEAVSPVLPLTVTIYNPSGAVVRTVKLLPVTVPVKEMVHVDAVTMFVGVLKMLVHGPLSAVLKPLPVTVTTAPAVPEAGLRVIVGPTTVNAALALSPLAPVTVTT